MAQLSWKKSLIKKAHTFMDFVVGWRGFYATVNAANKESRGTWAVPQKLTECPAQDDPINSIIELYYNLPFMHGRNNSPLRYRYPANNSTYEFYFPHNHLPPQSTNPATHTALALRHASGDMPFPQH